MVIVCGLSVGTLFTLFVLPALYSLLVRDKNLADEHPDAIATVPQAGI